MRFPDPRARFLENLRRVPAGARHLKPPSRIEQTVFHVERVDRCARSALVLNAEESLRAQLARLHPIETGSRTPTGRTYTATGCHGPVGTGSASDCARTAGSTGPPLNPPETT